MRGGRGRARAPTSGRRGRPVFRGPGAAGVAGAAVAMPRTRLPDGVFTERHDLVRPPAKLTTRAASWATDALTLDDTTVSALARHLGVDWHTCWDAVEAEAEATRRLADPARLRGVEVLGVDEHIWRPSRIGDAQRAVTGMVDLTRDAHGQLHARLLDVAPGRTGSAYADWLKKQPNTFTAGIKHACLDPFRGYANAIRDELPDAVAVLDAFHVVKVRHEVSCLRMEVRDLHRLVVAAAGLKLRAA